MKVIHSDKAPKAIGPYSQAIQIDKLLFCSGQIPLDPETKQIVGDTIHEQTKQVLKNITGLLSDCGATLENIIKTTIFLKNINDFSEVNRIYENAFKTHKPARSTVEVSRLPKDVLIEIECIATVQT